ncbi:MAG TPA: zf-HC2 domain-containing protein [Planctomycetota bacterium]|nr:zf-HC2 domain-containing protein [Planctomycetota bacterium]
MNCVFDKEKLSAFYDGELAAGEKAEVERHIASCSECLRDLGELKSAALLIKELPRLRAPKAIAEGVSREIQTAGKVQALARVRRVILWTSAAAAGLFVVVNALYMTNLKREASPMSASPPAVRALARTEPEASSAPPPPAPQRAAEPTREGDLGFAEDKSARRKDELRKNAAETQDRPVAAKTVEEAKKLDGAKERSEALAPGAPRPEPSLAKAGSSTPAPAVSPGPPAKSAVPLPLAEAPKPAAAPVVEKAAKEVEADRSADAKPKVAAAGASAELPPVQFNVVITQLSKARPRIEDSLKKMNVPLPPPAPSQPKAPRNREAENTIVLELTDAQLLRLCDELEKPGDARIVTPSSVEPVLPAFRRGGLFGGAKKEAGGASAPGSAPAPGAKEKDVKDAEDAAALKAGADALSGPRRRVTLHLVESKTLPPAEGDPIPPQKH